MTILTNCQFCAHCDVCKYFNDFNNFVKALNTASCQDLIGGTIKCHYYRSATADTAPNTGEHIDWEPHCGEANKSYVSNGVRSTVDGKLTR